MHLAHHQLQSVHMSSVITTVLNDMPVHDDVGSAGSSISVTHMRGNGACVYTHLMSDYTRTFGTDAGSLDLM